MQSLFAGQQDVKTTLQHIADAAKNRLTLATASPEATPA
jgi:hypothetical protein